MLNMIFVVREGNEGKGESMSGYSYDALASEALTAIGNSDKFRANPPYFQVQKALAKAQLSAISKAPSSPKSKAPTKSERAINAI